MIRNTQKHTHTHTHTHTRGGQGVQTVLAVFLAFPQACLGQRKPFTCPVWPPRRPFSFLLPSSPFHVFFSLPPLILAPPPSFFFFCVSVMFIFFNLPPSIHPVLSLSSLPGGQFIQQYLNKASPLTRSSLRLQLSRFCSIFAVTLQPWLKQTPGAQLAIWFIFPLSYPSVSLLSSSPPPPSLFCFPPVHPDRLSRSRTRRLVTTFVTILEIQQTTCRVLSSASGAL